MWMICVSFGLLWSSDDIYIYFPKDYSTCTGQDNHIDSEKNTTLKIWANLYDLFIWPIDSGDIMNRNQILPNKFTRYEPFPCLCDQYVPHVNTSFPWLHTLPLIAYFGCQMMPLATKLFTQHIGWIYKILTLPIWIIHYKNIDKRISGDADFYLKILGYDFRYESHIPVIVIKVSDIWESLVR